MQFTASARLHEKLERLRALMRSRVPDGDLGAVIEVAVTETSSASRHIPAPVRRAVRERDGDRCNYVDAAGRRCRERDRLEYHHLHPFGMGGDHRPENIRLTCHAHNIHLAEHDYGREAIARFRRSGQRVSEAEAVGLAGTTGPRVAGPGRRRASPVRAAPSGV